MLDTGDYSLEIEAGKRIVKCKKKLQKKEEVSIKRICWEKRKGDDEKERMEVTKGNREETKRQFMEKLGWSGREWNRKIEEEVERKLKEIYEK